MPNQLEQLKKVSTVVADTGDIEAIRIYKPEDATTNPSLIYKAAQNPKYQNLLKQCLAQIKEFKPYFKSEISDEKIAIEIFAVKLGAEILKIIPGRISTEIDASLSFSTQAMIESARRIIQFYEKEGVERSRVLIKVAASWEGIEATRILQAEGIDCNVTLIFNFYQAIAAAQAGAFLISPFVGRILDWHKKHQPEQDYSGEKDPGVISVSRIYQHFKTHHYPTIVMGASFRSIEEIQMLAGCDRLTISPELMETLSQNQNVLTVKLKDEFSRSREQDVTITQELFRWQLNEDAMVTEKLAEGIRNFTQDQRKLETLIKQLL